MKSLIHKITNWIKANYISSMIVLAIVLVVIASIIIVGLIGPKKNKIVLNVDNSLMYQYFSTNKIEFEAKISEENKKIVNIDSDTHDIYEVTPIYYKDEIGMIIPKNSAIVFYYRDNLIYQLPKYSKLTNVDDANIINSNSKTESASNFFIYDGEDLYIIPNDCTIKVNNQEITLSGYSYIIADINGVTYYNYELDEVIVIDEQIKSASLIINDVGIDLLKDVTVINSKVRLLPSNVSNL